jgi:DtxR family manganese transport transcriptional regulator
MAKARPAYLGETAQATLSRLRRRAEKWDVVFSFVIMRERSGGGIWRQTDPESSSVPADRAHGKIHGAIQQQTQLTKVNEKMSLNNETAQRSENKQRRDAVLQAVLARVDGRLSQNIIEELKKDLGVSRATAYRMIKTFRTCGAAFSPTRRPVGRPKGARVLDPKREELIHEAIRVFYSKPTRPRFSELVQDIARCCRDERLPAPNWRTIRARLRDFDAAKGHRRNGASE